VEGWCNFGGLDACAAVDEVQPFCGGAGVVEGRVGRGEDLHGFRADYGGGGEVACPPAVGFDEAGNYAMIVSGWLMRCGVLHTVWRIRSWPSIAILTQYLRLRLEVSLGWHLRSPRKAIDLVRTGVVSFGSWNNFLYIRKQAPSRVSPLGRYGFSSVSGQLRLIYAFLLHTPVIEARFRASRLVAMILICLCGG
jgi:hypothetical protein